MIAVDSPNSRIETIDFSGWKVVKNGQHFTWLLNPGNIGRKTEFPNFAIVLKETNTVEAFANSYLAASSVFEDSEDAMTRILGSKPDMDIPEPPAGVH